MLIRFRCCEHCLEEQCPKLDGHLVSCTIPGCEPVEVDPIEEEKDELTAIESKVHKDILIEKIIETLGYEPVELRGIIKLLSHPAIISSTNAYFGRMDASTMCLNYEFPWNCAREADARYENIRYGWTGAGGVIGGDWWCENCRKKAMGE